MIKAYKDYWKGYADFTGRTSVGGYWFAVLAHLLITFVFSFVLGILGQRGSTQTVTSHLTAFGLLCILPSLSILVRRLRDAGCSWTNLFWMFLPIAGPIILIVKLCKPSAMSTPSTLSTSWTTGAELGPWRIPAAILLLWGTLTVLASVISARMLPAMNVFWWLLRLSLIALVVLILIGKKNVGLLIPSGLVFLLSLRGLVLTPAIANLLSTAGWAAACLVMALAIFRKKSPPAVLLYLPSGLLLALSIYWVSVAVRNSGFTISVFTNALWTMGFFCMAKALAEEPRVQPAARTSTGGSSFNTSPQPQLGQPYAPTGYTAPNRKNPGVLLVRFNIDKLNNLSGPYGFQSGKLIGQAVPAALLEGMTISDGDSAATLAGQEYVCVVSIASDDISILSQKIEPLLQASKEIRENGANPITQVVGSTREPLVVDGVVRNGRIEGSGGWCANGLMSAWKEAAERSAEAAQAGAAAQKNPAHWARLVDKLAHFQTFSFDRSEEAAMGKELLSGGDAALQAIVTYLISCASGRQSDYWWSDAAYLVKLIAKFPEADHESIYKKLIAPQTNIWEYHTQIKDVAQQELLNLRKAAPGYDAAMISDENAQAELKSLFNMRGSEEERLKRAIAMRANSENWSDENKAFYYYIIGDVLQSRNHDDARKNAFYAAQVFYQPMNTSLGWYELKKSDKYKDFSPSPENAKLLHEMLPLPENWDDLLKPYTEDQAKKEKPVSPDEVPGGRIRHITCICWDAPYINSLKGEMQEFILQAEQARGSEITPTSRITFDSFYDNASLEKPEMIRQMLVKTYMQVYPNADALADKTVAREVRQKDGHTLVKYFVLYE